MKNKTKRIFSKALIIIFFSKKTYKKVSAFFKQLQNFSTTIFSKKILILAFEKYLNCIIRVKI